MVFDTRVEWCEKDLRNWVYRNNQWYVEGIENICFGDPNFALGVEWEEGSYDEVLHVAYTQSQQTWKQKKFLLSRIQLILKLTHIFFKQICLLCWLDKSIIKKLFLIISMFRVLLLAASFFTYYTECFRLPHSPRFLLEIRVRNSLIIVIISMFFVCIIGIFLLLIGVH